MANEEVYGKIKDLVSKHLNIDESEVTKEASFIEDLGADSLDTVELIMSFEEEFDIEIPDEDAESIKTVQNVIEYIEAHKA
jgi:acyl carrier protein